MKTKIIIELDDLNEAQLIIDRLTGRDSFVQVINVPAAPASEAPPAPAMAVDTAAPVAAAPKRTRKPRVSDPDPVPAEEPAAPAPAPGVTDSDREPVATQAPAATTMTDAFAAAAAGDWKPPLGPTFSILNDTPHVKETAAPAPSATVAPAPATPEAAPAAAAPSVGDAQSAIEAVLARQGAGAAMATLSRFGTKRSRELKEDQRAEFIAYCAQVVAGKIDPLAGTGVAK